MVNKVLVINLGWEQESLVREVARQGYEVIGVHYNDEWNRDLLVSRVEILDVRDYGAILELARHVKPDAVISDQCDYSLFSTAVVAEALGLPGPRIEQAMLTTNKWLQRRRASKSGLKQPQYRLCTSPEEAMTAANELGFPVVIKPVDNRGSFGVNRVDEPEQLKRAYLDALVNSHSRYVLVEQFIGGVHITIDGYCFPEAGHQSLALATKRMLGGERQVAMDIVYPGELSEKVMKAAFSNNQDVVSVMGLDYGMTHAEYMIDDAGEIYLIEIANRGGGVFTSSAIVPAVSGIDLTRQLVFDATRSGTDMYSTGANTTKSSAILSFVSFSPGSVKSISGVEAALRVPGVLACRLSISVGDEIEDVTTDADRHGFIITSAGTMEAARAAIDDARKCIQIGYD
jgi:biotin carboxylase